MDAGLTREINRLLALVGVTSLLSLFLQSLWPLVGGLSLYILWSTRQLFKLYQWIINREEYPPDSQGLWGDVNLRLEQAFKSKRRAQENLEAIIARARDSVNALDDGVVLTDKYGHLEYWNLAAQHFLRLSPDVDMNQPITNLVRAPRFIRYFNRADFSEPLAINAPGDETLILQFSITEFGPGDRLMLVRDVTRVHHLEEMRKDFVANVSHELKTPLTVLRGYLETLLDTVPGEQQKMHRALEQMDQQAHRMQALVFDLLLLARLEATQADNQNVAVPLHGMLGQLRDDALALAPEKHQRIELEVAAEARLVGNAPELESAFGNLLSNAVKYSDQHGRIRVSFRQDEQGAHLSVTDNGIGIDPSHIPRLTERFYRPDNSRHTATGGTGLGLAIVKHVMKRHGGWLEISSELGRGSTFTCHFPKDRLVSKPTAVAG